MDVDSTSSDDTSSDYTTESSEDDGMETAEVDGVRLQLPQGLCERKEIFTSVLSTDTWNSFSDTHKQYLQTFLPNFPENDDEEKNRTLQKLFDCDTFWFNNPLEKFHEDLKAGYFRPDIANMRKIIKKAERNEAIYRHKKYREKLKQDVIESQRKLMNQISNLPPGVEPKIDKNTDPSLDYVVHRAKRRYYQILTSIQSKVDDGFCSPDENYPEGPPVPLSRKQRRHLTTIKNSSGPSSDTFTSTMSSKTNGLDLERYVTPTRNPFYITDDTYKTLIMEHKRRKVQHRDEPEFNTRGITTLDIVNRTQLPYIKNLQQANKHHSNEHKLKKKTNKRRVATPPAELYHNHHHHKNSYAGRHHHSSNSDSDSDSYIDAVTVVNHNKNKIKMKSSKIHKRTETTSKKEPAVLPKVFTPPPKIEMPAVAAPPISTTSATTKSTNGLQYGKITPVTISDLEGIDMMNIPIDLDNSDIDILELNNKPELMQETHSNFLSLIRDVICSTTEHRMSFRSLEERLRTWQDNPISPLNDWYHLCDNWFSLLNSAVNFLCGNSSDQPDDFVPYMEHKSNLDMYQWIGAGRDSDALLVPLCQYWLEHRGDCKSNYLLTTAVKDEIDVEVSDRSQTPPPPRCPTAWIVRKATADEIKEFREQERRRYDNPHKAFTYRCNGYESIVGPLKGIYNPSLGGNTKARGHTMLNADRPNFVTILSLVRDATARLPNGEGTRAEICELLKSSQYISSTAPDNILQSVVSGALDRMHTQFDPCVKYDAKRKIWLYLHRNRSEEDFERLHQQFQGVNKNRKAPAGPKKTPSKPKTPKSDKVAKVKSETSAAVAAPITVVGNAKVVKTKGPEMVTVTVSSGATSNNVVTSGASGGATKTNSLLLSNQEIKLVDDAIPLPTKQITTLQAAEEKEINEALQTIVQNRASPTITSRISTPTKGKSLVKIITPAQGKSLIIPSHRIQEGRNTPTKQLSQQQVVAQQLLQTITAKQKQAQTIQIVQKSVDISEATKQDLSKTLSTTQSQFIQSITPQQLQNIKNVTLMRNISQNQQGLTTLATVAEHGKAGGTLGEQIQIKTQTTLTPAQQHQIIQTIKQKILPQATVLSSQQQQLLLKQKAIAHMAGGKQQIQVTSQGTSLLGQAKIGTAEISKGVLTSGQNPVVAKVLTNAAGQVISVESLLAHQKQHGSLPQGTTLRVSGTKGGQTNIIQLTGTKQNPMAQFAVASQNNIIAITSQPKLVVASHTHATNVTASMTATSGASSTATIVAPSTIATAVASIGLPKTMVRPGVTTNKTQTVSAKFTPKVAQQLINAKLVTAQSVDGQKIVQPKIYMGQQNQMKLATAKNISLSKPVTLSMTGNANTIRMVNATNLNLTHIGGKPVLLASKGSTIQNIQGQNVILQTQPNSSGGSLVLQNAVKAVPSTTTNISQQNSPAINIINQQNVMLGPQLKMQTPQQVVFSAGVKSATGGVSNQSQGQQGHIVLEGHPVRLQTSTGTNSPQRVVLASQGQGGQIVAQQILLPAGFQGTAINIKALQGVKVIPIAQAHGPGRGVQGRQVFARVMSPAIVKATTSTTAAAAAAAAAQQDKSTPMDPTITSSSE